MLELFDRQVDGGEPIRRRRFAPKVVPPALEGDLAHLLGGDPRVVLLGEVHLRPIHPPQITIEAADLLFGRRAQCRGNVGVTGTHGDLQGHASWVAWCQETLHLTWARCTGDDEPVDLRGAALAQGPSRSREGGSGGGDVIDDEHRARHPTADEEAGMAPPLPRRQAGLGGTRPAGEEPADRQAAPASDGACEQLGLVEAAGPATMRARGRPGDDEPGLIRNEGGEPDSEAGDQPARRGS